MCHLGLSGVTMPKFSNGASYSQCLIHTPLLMITSTGLQERWLHSQNQQCNSATKYYLYIVYICAALGAGRRQHQVLQFQTALAEGLKPSLTVHSCISCSLVASRMTRMFSLLADSCCCCFSFSSDSFRPVRSLAAAPPQGKETNN